MLKVLLLMSVDVQFTTFTDTFRDEPSGLRINNLKVLCILITYVRFTSDQLNVLSSYNLL